MAFLDTLVEDYADEWLTKAMFHYRWRYPADIGKATRLLPLDVRLELIGETLETASRRFAERQIARLAVDDNAWATRSTLVPPCVCSSPRSTGRMFRSF